MRRRIGTVAARQAQTLEANTILKNGAGLGNSGSRRSSCSSDSGIRGRNPLASHLSERVEVLFGL